jgi:hypothetical protein
MAEEQSLIAIALTVFKVSFRLFANIRFAVTEVHAQYFLTAQI